MPSFDILRESVPGVSFRVDAIRAMFDLQARVIQERFSGSIDLDGKDWNVGVIYGASGTGKSSIAQELFLECYIRAYDYRAASVIDDMPQECDIKTIASAFNSVGFSSPPSWLKPYSVLSNGEKMRADLARAILESRELIVFDEFTSVINREVAKIGSAAIAKAVRRQKKSLSPSPVMTTFCRGWSRTGRIALTIAVFFWAKIPEAENQDGGQNRGARSLASG